MLHTFNKPELGRAIIGVKIPRGREKAREIVTC